MYVLVQILSQDYNDFQTVMGKLGFRWYEYKSFYFLKCIYMRIWKITSTSTKSTISDTA